MDVPLRVGNEGAGVVTAVGMDSDEDAWELLGKTVGILGGQMYTQYRVVPYKSALELLPDTSPAEGASAFVNPLTVLGMIETMRDEGHTAIVHTAAASQLGQMLVRACANEGIPLVNVVRRPEQVSLLSGLGAEHVVDSSSEEFMDDLVNAISATGATVGFDATGGGTLASQILTAMERSAVAAAGASQPGNRYGSDTFKQLYIYGGLDTTETRLNRSYGMRWGVGGWLLGPNFLERVGPERADAVRPPPPTPLFTATISSPPRAGGWRVQARKKVAEEIKTTFATSYSTEMSLREALSVDNLHEYGVMGAPTLIPGHALPCPPQSWRRAVLVEPALVACFRSWALRALYALHACSLSVVR